MGSTVSPVNKTLRTLVALLSLVAIATGIDYVTGNSYHMGRVWGDEYSTPLLWGIACLITATIALVGIATSKPKVLIFASCLGASVYAMFAVQIADIRMFAWPPEDIRLIANHVGQSFTWALVGVATYYRHGVDLRKEAILEEADG